MASRDIKDLAPQLQDIALAFKMRCKEQKLDIVIICTYRDDAEQLAAYKSKASNCRPGKSKHNKKDANGKPASEAFDVGVIRNGKYIGNGSDPDYLKAGIIGESLGLKWAGRWKGKLQETAHFEL